LFLFFILFLFLQDHTRMRRLVGWMGIGLLVSCLLAGCRPAENNVRHLVLSGSRTMGPLMREVGKRFTDVHTDVHINVEDIPGNHAVLDTRKGLAEIGMLGRPLRTEETGLHAVAIARDGLAIIVHRDNPVQSLTEGQIVGLFSGVYDSWKEVGGPDRPVKLAGQADGRAAREVFLEHFGLKTTGQVRANPAVANSEQAIQAVATLPFAIGYASFGAAEKAAAKLPIRILPLCGVLPTYDNVQSGRYLLVRPLQLLTREVPRGLTHDFIEFVRSTEVRELIKEYGFVPVSP
jgi:phosphate transport system substrate-binding protein